MPRPLWKGVVSFGMVSIPIKLYSATEEKDVRFNQLHKEDMSRVRQKLFCAEEDIEVQRDEIVRGFEISSGHYVVVEDEDFENVPSTKKHEIEITDFVSLESIDPILYQKTYYLEPEDLGMKPFALLMRTLQETERVAIAKVTMRQKEQLCSLRVYQNTIALETLFYSDEVRSTEELTTADVSDVTDRELAMAKMLVDSMSGDLNLEQYKDNYREALLEVIRAKSEGEVVEAPAAAAPAKITDLTEALRASVEEARRRKAVKEEEPPAKSRRAARAS